MARNSHARAHGHASRELEGDRDGCYQTAAIALRDASLCNRLSYPFGQKQCAERVRFRSAPAFYAVASSRPLSRLINERTASARLPGQTPHAKFMTCPTSWLQDVVIR